MMNLAYIVIPFRLASSHIMRMSNACVDTGIVIPSLSVSKVYDVIEIFKVFDYYHHNHSFTIYRHIFSNSKIFRIAYFFFFLIFASYKINLSSTIKVFDIHLVSIFFTVIKGVLKSSLTLKNDKETRIAKTVTRTKLVSFLKNYKEAIEGYRRNIIFFDK